MGIWKNIGKIVILLFQIVHEQVKWYIGTWTRVKRVSPKREQKNIYLDEQEESIERSKVMLRQYEYEQVEWSENPHIHLQKNEDS